VDLGLCPEEGFGGLVVGGDEGVDMPDEVLDAGEGGAVERLRGQDREPDFDLTEPGSVGWRVVAGPGESYSERDSCEWSLVTMAWNIKRLLVVRRQPNVNRLSTLRPHQAGTQAGWGPDIGVSGRQCVERRGAKTLLREQPQTAAPP
jgi:hypothetical protein